MTRGQKVASGIAGLIIVGAPTYGVYIKDYPAQAKTTETDGAHLTFSLPDCENAGIEVSDPSSNWNLVAGAGKIVARCVQKPR